GWVSHTRPRRSRKPPGRLPALHSSPMEREGKQGDGRAGRPKNKAPAQRSVGYLGAPDEMLFRKCFFQNAFFQAVACPINARDFCGARDMVTQVSEDQIMRLLVIVVAFLAVAFPALAQEKKTVTIAVSGPPAQLYFLPVVLAKQLGYFEQAQ